MRAAIVALTIVLATTSARAADPQEDPGGRVLHVERWLKAVLSHTPGVPDAAVTEISKWLPKDIELFRLDEGVLVQLMRDRALSTFQLPPTERECVDCFAARRDVTQARLLVAGRTIRYTDPQLHRMKVLACTAAGLLDNADCQQLHADREIDDDFRRLARLAAASKSRGDRHFVVRRGAMLEADVAIVTTNALRPIEAEPGSNRPYKVQMVDGEATKIGLGEIHWAIGRLLLNAVTPQPDAMVNLWYRATGAWMLREQQYNNEHLERARDLFPNDAFIAFLSGANAEIYASPFVQSAIKTAVLPAGVVFTIGNEGAELKLAEPLFQRAVRLDPAFVEARVHLGHVLLARGQFEEAITELTAVEIREPLLRYYANMFLGAAHEALGRVDAARAAYGRASAIFPRAQSPYLAVSALEARHGDRGAAMKSIDQVLAFPRDEALRDDPWWRYGIAAGRHASDLMEELTKVFPPIAQQ